MVKDIRRRRLAARRVVLGLLVLALPVLAACSSASAQNACVEHDRIGFHQHTRLTLSVGGIARGLPANVGITPHCMRPLHTHDESGVVHQEAATPASFTMGDFLSVWAASSGGDPLTGLKVSAVRVNGVAHPGDYKLVPLTDGGDIHISLSGNE